MPPTLCAWLLKIGFGSATGVEGTDGGVKVPLGGPWRHRYYTGSSFRAAEGIAVGVSPLPYRLNPGAFAPGMMMGRCVPIGVMPPKRLS